MGNNKTGKKGVTKAKEHEETTPRDLTNMDTSKMSELEFRIMIIRILPGVKNRLESFSRDIKEVKASQDDIKNAIPELPSRMDAMVARMDEAEQ